VFSNVLTGYIRNVRKRRVIEDNFRVFVNLVAILSLLLALCVVCDYATVVDVQTNSTTDVLGANASVIVASSNDEIHSEPKPKKSVPMITFTGKPSCGCNYGYYWHTRTYVNYCPNCHHYNCLANKHKYGARFEQEISCLRCDSDFCICCGKEKYSWSNVYLRKC